ncbi:CPBP family intramembrane metalloprotease [Adhaeribacter swui]|uniref:CPBP family intramembrane metalloprotease n=1 Tax=Adhaeribacter swui TaxID=2086471 RepID=A0A7G7G4Z9_9BACT|nr:CPBP family intramembrane glutamic endopeptidase [Adhaeribacter swui]QNF32233.1 CPBP family intramembrane metalloprotease [Adhaeribacter swui]
MHKELKPLWDKIFCFNWKFGLFLLLIICVPRFVLVLHANTSANYQYIGIIMVLSALAPFLFLSKFGRYQIGLKKPTNTLWLLMAFMAGLLFSILLWWLGQTLFGNSYHNWYVYIGQSYNIPAGINASDKAILFAVMAVTGMLFSPIGEELFFRGIVHASFAPSTGEEKASVIDSTAFALTHVAHFGLVYTNQQWQFLLLPTLIWVVSMFLVSRLFYVCKKNSGSILGAMVCHAAFNLGMIYCIFYGADF